MASWVAPWDPHGAPWGPDPSNINYPSATPIRGFFFNWIWRDYTHKQGIERDREREREREKERKERERKRGRERAREKRERKKARKRA